MLLYLKHLKKLFESNKTIHAEKINKYKYIAAIPCARDGLVDQLYHCLESPSKQNRLDSSYYLLEKSFWEFRYQFCS